MAYLHLSSAITNLSSINYHHPVLFLVVIMLGIPLFYIKSYVNMYLFTILRAAAHPPLLLTHPPLLAWSLHDVSDVRSGHYRFA